MKTLPFIERGKCCVQNVMLHFYVDADYCVWQLVGAVGQRVELCCRREGRGRDVKGIAENKERRVHSRQQ